MTDDVKIVRSIIKKGGGHMGSDKFSIDLSKDERYNPSSLDGEFLNAVVAILKFYINKEDKKNGNEE